MNKLLKPLVLDDFSERFVGASTTDGLLYALGRNATVKEIQQGIVNGSISDAELHAFVHSVLSKFAPGIFFAGDLTLAALVVAVSSDHGDFANAFLSQLTRIRATELSRSSRIAAMVVQRRRTTSTTRSTTLKEEREQLGLAQPSSAENSGPGYIQYQYEETCGAT